MLGFWPFASRILADVSKHLPLHLMKYFKVWIENFSEDSWSNCRVCHCVLDEIKISVSLQYTSHRCSGHWLLISSFSHITSRTQIRIEMFPEAEEMSLWVRVPALQA